MSTGERIVKINIEEEMKSAYIDYSMSVIVSRALPDVRDGLKPVHRRVLYGMNGLGLSHNKSHKKSARIVGEVLGKYHPHGDSSVYDSMVRMAQEWSLRYMLVDGQGNYGSMDGDSPAAMRYTEARLRRLAGEMLTDIDKDTVDYSLNFDDTLEEPTVLPTKFPNLLVNGASGIAVGMATNMMPHNLNEVCDGIMAYIDNPEIDTLGLMQHIKAPDFPTGGIIYGMDGVKEAFETGRGRVVLRSKAEVEELPNGRERIVVTEVPYQVNKANMIKKAADLINAKKIEGVSEIRDESDRNGIRIVFEVRKDASGQVVLNQLYKQTGLQTSYGINNVCLVNGRPRLLNLKELIKYFVEFRHEVVVRRTEYLLREAEARAHILEGLMIAIDNLDEVIAIIRASQTPAEAQEKLMERFNLSERQSKAILEMRLQKLTGLERAKLKKEYDEVMAEITDYKDILGDKNRRMSIIKEELKEIKDKFGDPRRTEITHADGDISMMDVIENEKVAITISNLGYVKRTTLNEYREQGRGGTGSRGGSTRDEDFIEQLVISKNHNYMLFFTEAGKCYWLRVYQIPEGTKTSKGRAIQNLINIDKEDTVKSWVSLPDLKDEELLDNNFVMFCTKKGVIKKTALRAFSRPRSNGINALTIREGDTLLDTKLTNGNCDVFLAVKSGRAIRFDEAQIRAMGRSAAGVRGIKLKSDSDEVVGMVCIDPADEAERHLLCVSEKGYGKRSRLEEYSKINRGGMGVKTLQVTDKTGELLAIKDVTPADGIMIITKSGTLIRLAVDGISIIGRSTQGVRLIKIKGDDALASVALIRDTGEDMEEEEASAEGDAVEGASTDAQETGEKTEDTAQGDKPIANEDLPIELQEVEEHDDEEPVDWDELAEKEDQADDTEGKNDAEDDNEETKND